MPLEGAALSAPVIVEREGCRLRAIRRKAGRREKGEADRGGGGESRAGLVG